MSNFNNHYIFYNRIYGCTTDSRLLHEAGLNYKTKKKKKKKMKIFYNKYTT